MVKPHETLVRGFNLWDRDELPHYATQRNARRLSELGGVAFLAQLLATPRADGQKPIVALVRGRQVGKPLGRQVGYPVVNLVTEGSGEPGLAFGWS